MGLMASVEPPEVAWLLRGFFGADGRCDAGIKRPVQRKLASQAQSRWITLSAPQNFGLVTAHVHHGGGFE